MNLPEIKIKIDIDSTNTKPRKLKAVWSMETFPVWRPLVPGTAQHAAAHYIKENVAFATTVDEALCYCTDETFSVVLRTTIRSPSTTCKLPHHSPRTVNVVVESDRLADPEYLDSKVREANAMGDALGAVLR